VLAVILILRNLKLITVDSVIFRRIHPDGFWPPTSNLQVVENSNFTYADICM